jgi:hypothetical protein
MAPTADWRDAQKIASATSALGGTVPAPLQHLLSAYELLAHSPAAQAPETAILDAVLDGSLDAAKLKKLAPVAAAEDNTAAFLKRLSQDRANFLVAQWHRLIKAGCGDELLDSLRPNFTKHAEAIEHAKTLFNAESTAEMVIELGEPEVIDAWKGLDVHLTVVSRICMVAKQFGINGEFSQVVEYSLGDNFRIDDRALACGTGDLVSDSAVFMRPDGPHRRSAFFQIGLKLHSIDEMRQRYANFAAIESDRINHPSGRGGWVDPKTGQIHQDKAPVNPFRETVST